MPRSRTFSSSASAQSPKDGDGGREAAATASRVQDTLPIVLGVMGGAAAGAALAVVTIMLLGSASAAGSASPAGAAYPDGLSGFEALTAVDGRGVGGAATVDAGAATVDVGATSNEIIVAVAGAVRSPGLHRLRIGDRVGDAIAAAGGFAPRADLAEADRSLNLAQPLSDGDKVLVPELGIDGPREAQGDDDRINLNTADQAALESLPGIGPVTAAKIIEARSQQRFDSVRDLLERGVVGQAVFEDIEAMVRT